MVCNPFGNRVYELKCTKCDWATVETVAMGPNSLRIGRKSGENSFIEKLILKMKLPTKCPECGAKISIEELPVSF